jgi:hypothetical protein
MNDILSFLRTSLVKNPEEWSFEEQVHSSGKVFSTMNLFFHSNTSYILILIHVPEIENENKEITSLYYIQLLEYEDYLELIEQNDGNFTPEQEFIYPVNSESVIVKTLMFIKNMTIEDEEISRYSKFKEYITEKYKTKINVRKKRKTRKTRKTA